MSTAGPRRRGDAEAREGRRRGGRRSPEAGSSASSRRGSGAGAQGRDADGREPRRRPRSFGAGDTGGEQIEGVRLQKVLAQAGVASRRAAEQLIAQGRVTVDGAVVREQGVRVDPERTDVRVDGDKVTTQAGVVHLALNKPRGVVTTMSDPEGRECVGDLVADRPERLVHVGRLDTDSEGLLLLTGDGSLAHGLTHPSSRVEKTYLVDVRGVPGRAVLRRLSAGVALDGRAVEVDDVRVLDEAAGRALVEITIHEGRNRVVRRLMEEVGHPVTQLVRTRVGPVHVGTLRAGRVRHLTSHEVGALYRDAGL